MCGGQWDKGRTGGECERMGMEYLRVGEWNELEVGVDCAQILKHAGRSR